MTKKSSTNVDTKELSAVTTEESKASAVVDNSKVSNDKKKKPRVIKLDDIDAFDPSATHEDFSEHDKFDDEDDPY